MNGNSNYPPKRPQQGGAQYGSQNGAPRRNGAQYGSQNGAPRRNGSQYDPQNGAQPQGGAQYDPRKGVQGQSGAQYSPQNGAPYRNGAQYDPQYGAPRRGEAPNNRPNGAQRPNMPRTVRERRDPANMSRIDPETNEFRRAQRENARYKIRRRGELRSRITAWLTLFAIVLALMLALCAAVFFINLIPPAESGGGSYSYTYGSSRAVSVPAEDALRDGVLYVNMTALSDMLGFAVTGDSSNLRFVMPAEGGVGGEWVSFELGSRAADVNGQKTPMAGDAVMDGEQLWIPADFVTTYMNGVALTVDDAKRAVVIKRETAEGGDGEAVDVPVTFKLKPVAPLDAISEEQFAEPAIEFKSDLSAYEQYMNPENRDDYIVLVNQTHTLDKDYVPADLIDVADTRSDRSKRKMRECAAKALEAFFIEMRANNINLVSVTSAYRSYAEQVTLFEQRKAMYPNLSEEEAYTAAATVVAPPGTSEHQTGLSCDMHNLSSADVSFADTGAYKWMVENAYKFGFILRYPEDKQDITGISFEPWHYRFVGRYHATRMHELGMCLEEYVEYLGKS